VSSDAVSTEPAADPFTRRDGAVGEPPQHYGNPLGEQRELAAGRAVVDLSDRDILSITGPDRLSWLDSLTSQRLIGLAPGVGAETLLLDPRDHLAADGCRNRSGLPHVPEQDALHAPCRGA
jgi:glycine cleavage system aminomethyltransferase T